MADFQCNKMHKISGCTELRCLVATGLLFWSAGTVLGVFGLIRWWKNR
jgi:hypothetical protein